MGDLYLPEIISCGYFNCLEQFGDLKRSPERISKGIEIELFLEDGYSTFIDGKELKILKNHIIVAKAGSKRYSLLPFKTLFLKISAVGEVENLLNSLPDYFFALHNETIKEMLHEIVLLYEEKQQHRLEIGAKILLLIDYLIKDARFKDTASEHAYPLMHKAKKIIEDRYAERLSAADIADLVNLSESRFRFLFKETYGITPRQYVTNIRIANAKQMLLENLSMSEISERCGFGCQQYFDEIFKKETGMSPTKYKKEVLRRYYD